MELFINERVCRTHRGEKLLWVDAFWAGCGTPNMPTQATAELGMHQRCNVPASPQQKACSIQAFRGDSPERHALGNNFSPQNTEDTFARDAFKTHISAQEYNCALKFILV